MIYGLTAALGWGLADYAGAIGGRRIGSLPTVVIGQVLSAVFMVVLVVATGQDVSRAGSFLGLLTLNGLFTSIAYMTHYRALELGPVAVVSPIGASYAVVGIALAMLIRDEQPGGVALLGAAVTVAGVALVSTDLRALRAGIRGHAPGAPWAVVAAVAFGVAAFLLGTAAQELGWILGLGASRVAQVIAFVPLAVIRRDELAGIPRRRGAGMGVLFALCAGAADLLGVTTYSAGAEAGLVSIVLAASAIFPAVAVGLSIGFLHERLVANQWGGSCSSWPGCCCSVSPESRLPSADGHRAPRDVLRRRVRDRRDLADPERRRRDQAGHGTLGSDLLDAWPAYLGYAVSFLTIGVIWVNHHTVWR